MMINEFPEGRSRNLPDMNQCRVRDIGLEHYAWCLVERPMRCEYALSFGSGFLCRHPNMREIAENAKDSSLIGELKSQPSDSI